MRAIRDKDDREGRLSGERVAHRTLSERFAAKTTIKEEMGFPPHSGLRATGGRNPFSGRPERVGRRGFWGARNYVCVKSRFRHGIEQGGRFHMRMVENSIPLNEAISKRRRQLSEVMEIISSLYFLNGRQYPMERVLRRGGPVFFDSVPRTADAVDPGRLPQKPRSKRWVSRLFRPPGDWRPSCIRRAARNGSTTAVFVAREMIGHERGDVKRAWAGENAKRRGVRRSRASLEGGVSCASLGP